MTLDPEDIEAIASRTVELLRERGGPETPWLTVQQVAQLIGVSPAFVYQHQEQLGARRLGDSSRAPLRFERVRVEAWMDDDPGLPRPQKPRRRRKKSGGEALAGFSSQSE